jgi:hypothetical protein
LKNNTYHYRTSTKVWKMNVEQNVNELVKQLK